MKRLFFFLAFYLAGTSFLLAAFPSPRGYVTDEAKIIDAETQQKIEGLLTELEQKTNAQIAVVTVNSLDDRPIEEYAPELFKAWGIGHQGKDNGVLFLVAPHERRGRIEVGYGLEPVITDAQAGRLLDEAVIPFMKEGRPSEGILNGTVALAVRVAEASHVTLSGSSVPLPRAEGAERKSGWFDFVFIILFVVIFVFSLFGRRRRGFYGGGPWMGGGFGGGGFGGGGFGGFGGGGSGGGGSSRGW